MNTITKPQYSKLHDKKQDGMKSATVNTNEKSSRERCKRATQNEFSPENITKQKKMTKEVPSCSS